MKILKGFRNAAILCSTLWFVFLANTSANAGVMLEGMGSIKQWTDFENQIDEIPDNIWGTSDTDGADRIGLMVEFENGLSGTVTYSGVSGLWNSTFSGIASDTSTGFFTSASGLHFLFNNPRTTVGSQQLPMAWTSFSMPFSNNFDLDYVNRNGSNFRASTSGWSSATFTTFSSTAPVNAVPEPGSIACFGFIGLAALARRRRSARRS